MDTNPLRQEYEQTFTSDERFMMSIAQGTKLSITQQDIEIEKIALPKLKRVTRTESLIGLNAIVEEWGVVTPIHVMTTEDADNYILLDGLRRVTAAARNGITTIKAIIWDFEDKVGGKKVAPILSLMLNRSERFRNKEIWEAVKLLEKQDKIGPGDIEYALQLNSGDYMKLKDVMLADSDFAEIQSDFLDGNLTIDSAYKKLVNQRKKENRLLKDDKRDMSVVEGNDLGEVSASAGGDDSDGSEQEQEKLSLDEVKELLDLKDEEGDLDEKFDGVGDYAQDPKHRELVDRELKQTVFERDNYTCQCCKAIDASSGNKALLTLLVFHHIIMVSQGGTDCEENGLTVCQNCHMLIHYIIHHGTTGDLSVLNGYSKTALKNALRYAKIAVKAYKLKGGDKKKFLEENKKGLRHLFPDENLKDNVEMFEKHAEKQAEEADSIGEGVGVEEA